MWSEREDQMKIGGEYKIQIMSEHFKWTEKVANILVF